ncbi:MAG TPA: LysR substrate-binding domain-containing protein, partial [Rhodocyclaceae bacterium]|nr:LysR substrate-binding domain-containing protein [Rhodocyclaceae bacterium]
SNETIKQAVMAGLGLGFLSLHTIGLELASNRLRVLDVAGLPVRRRWNLCARQDRLLSPAALAFRQFVLQDGQELLLEGVLGPRP